MASWLCFLCQPPIRVRMDADKATVARAFQDHVTTEHPNPPPEAPK